MKYAVPLLIMLSACGPKYVEGELTPNWESLTLDCEVRKTGHKFSFNTTSDRISIEVDEKRKGNNKLTYRTSDGEVRVFTPRTLKKYKCQARTRV